MSETVTLYKCDKCKTLITDPKSGVVVNGNIYVADPNERGGLVGNNFPQPEERAVRPEAVKESVYCQTCFLKVVFPNLRIQTLRGPFDGVDK